MGLGTFGQIATGSLYQQKKAQYPNQYVANDFASQYGLKVHDCVGLIKGYLWTNDDGILRYDASQDKDVSGMLKMCKEQASIDTIPEVPGLLVFMSGHVGIYIGNGEVIEARGHAYGVVKTQLAKRPWTKWGKLDYLTYEKRDSMTQAEQIELIKSKVGLDDNTIQYFKFYKFGDALIEKLANSLKSAQN